MLDYFHAKALSNFRIFGGLQRGGANEKIVLLKAEKRASTVSAGAWKLSDTVEDSE